MEVQEEAAGPFVAERLEIKADALVQRAVRLRTLNGEPFSHLVNYIPETVSRRYTHKDLSSGSMLTLLERVGASPQEAEQWISAVGAGAEIATALDVSPGTPLLRIDRVMRGPRSKPVQLIEAHYRPDRFHYHFRTRKNAQADGRLDPRRVRRPARP